MKKSYARKRMLKLRAALDSDICLTLSDRICQRFLKSDEYKNASSILMYKAYNNEVDTAMVFEAALASGKTVAFPRSEIVNGEPEMSFYIVRDKDSFVSGYKGISEPDESCEKFTGRADICITPGVAFDKACHRVGYGKGFYDRFLGKSDVGAVIGFAYDIQVADMIETDATDISTDMVITETSVYRR